LAEGRQEEYLQRGLQSDDIRMLAPASKADMSHDGNLGCNFFECGLCIQVLVGRNNLQNDELTHKVANDTDLWFHARGRPGSHTVLRIPSGRCESPPPPPPLLGLVTQKTFG